MPHSHNPAHDTLPVPVVDDAFIRDCVQRIVDRAKPEKVILFGSRANGRATADSDIDLFIIMESDLPWWKRKRFIDDILAPHGWLFDIMVYTPQEFAQSRHVLGMIPHIAEHEGKIQYERK